MKHPLRDEVIIATMMAFGQGHRYAFGKGHYKPADLNLNELSHSKNANEMDEPSLIENALLFT